MPKVPRTRNLEQVGLNQPCPESKLLKRPIGEKAHINFFIVASEYTFSRRWWSPGPHNGASASTRKPSAD